MNYATPNDEESFLYIISWENTPDVVKIGRTNCPAKRFNTFLCAHPDPLIIRCLCPESIMSEADLHARHQSARITLEHFKYTEALKETIEMLNMSNNFTSYTIPRTLDQTGLVDDSPTIGKLKQNMAIPPIRISPAEKRVAELAAVGATVKESADALGLSESAIKSHRTSITQKGFMPNFCSSLFKLALHEVLDLKDLKDT